MTRRKWIGWFAALAAIALLIPLTPWFSGRAPGETTKNNKQMSTMTAHQERQMKLAAVKSDMDATALLCTTECARNFEKLIRHEAAAPMNKQHLQHMMKMHKQMVFVWWHHQGGSITQGAKPSSGELDALIGQAKKQVMAGTDFTSPPLQANGHRYMVIGQADKQHKGDGIVGVLLQDIVMKVQDHQRRNLRLVPYPAEGKYKIESVSPNSTTDITVNDGEQNGNASHYHLNEVVVRFKVQPSAGEMAGIQRDIHAISTRKLGYTYVFRSRVMEADDMMRYFQRSRNVVYAEPHYLYMTNDARTGSEAEAGDGHESVTGTAGANSDADTDMDITPNDALYSRYQWNLPIIEAEKGWNLSKGSDQVLIGVLDTGVQADHPDLIGKLDKGTNLVDETSPPDDDVGHGTHVSGIIAASVNNGEGVAGLTWYNKIVPIKVLDSSGAGSTYSVAEGIIWATDHGIKVINMSLGNYAEAQFLHDAIKYAYDRDVVLVAASGNDNTERPGYPAAYPEVLAVGSTNADSTRSPFSNYGDYIDVAAPGMSIASTYPGSQYAALSGTSMASPHVAALAGLIRSINPDLKNTEVMDIIRESAQDLGSKGKDNYFGYGQIDIDKALLAARQSKVSLQQFPKQVERRLAQIERKYS
ncbi:S8 family peptidase [Paenibacillus sacheonensis]|uniref:S8 family serine peptidase n=1 Tax=Paenibacillus sacheonensis TaxID=742054 RepID=A0A7X4YTG9_9BACL|nr:S8 family peptidase [Paenibacillus sacheonensis]MBM7565667.1 subtilisin family serine protease [Paenibacillus sacheonensis]NBC72275.1 S8 family serine peptidase [Paenibacillus sacheonensis]